MHPLIRTVYDTIIKHQLLQEGDTVVVALSGGADSVSLLHCVLSLQTVLGLRGVRAVHVHHGLRGAQADRDERFVKRLCDSLNVPLKTVHVETASEAKQHSETIEEAGRRLRYTALEEEARSCLPSKIATAHSADDQAETMLMRIVRGCGTKGLGGIPIRRGNIVRPLLSCTAEEIRAFCKERALDYVVDETNMDETYTRNFMRHRLMSPLKEFEPCAARHMATTAKIVGEEDRFLDSLAVEGLDRAIDQDGCLSVAVLIDMDPVLVRRVIRMACERRGGSPEYRHIERIAEHIGQTFAVTVPGALTVRCSPSRIEWQKEAEVPLPRVWISDVPCVISFGGKRYRVSKQSKKEFDSVANVHKNVLHFCISYDMIKGDLCLRAREQGDRIRPIGRGCSKSLKKWMNEQHIPCSVRDALPVLSDSSGVLAVLGRVIDERGAVTQTTESVLYLEEIEEF